MHFKFDFSSDQIIWTLTFAGLLVLLVVLLGRDRARRFPWFTAVTVMMALRMVTGRLLAQRLAPIVFNEIFLALYDLAVLLSLGLAVEIARRAFKGAGRLAWIVGSLVVLAVGLFIMIKWGPWPAWKTLMAGSKTSSLRIMQLFAQKTDVLDNMLFIELGVLVAFFGRSFRAGWRSHTQQIAIGLSTASIMQAGIRFVWQQIALHTTVHSQNEYTRVMNLQEKLFNASNVVYLVVLLWWIACLWVDEPGGMTGETAVAGAPSPGEGEPNPLETPAAQPENSPAESSAANVKANDQPSPR